MYILFMYTKYCTDYYTAVTAYDAKLPALSSVIIPCVPSHLHLSPPSNSSIRISLRFSFRSSLFNPSSNHYHQRVCLFYFVRGASVGLLYFYCLGFRCRIYMYNTYAGTGSLCTVGQISHACSHSGHMYVSYVCGGRSIWCGGMYDMYDGT